VLKNAFERDRPAGAAEWLTSGHSFPSGHAAGSLMVVGLLAWLLCRGLAPGWRGLIGAAALALVLGIGAARVVLHVHYASDVLGGWLLAGALLVLAVAALRPAVDARI
jgi:undecaprenyl-diphosphatase